MQGVHTAGPRCPHGGPISPRKSTPEGAPLTGDRAAEDTAGAHGGPESHIHHSGSAVGHFWNRSQDVFSNPWGPPLVIIFGRRRWTTRIFSSCVPACIDITMYYDDSVDMM